jgi:hypothetical protein
MADGRWPIADLTFHAMQLWIGIFTFVAGGVLWYVCNRDRALVPAWIRRLALGITALGLSTLAATQPELWWKISSISFSLIAIILIGSVLLEHLRRR